MTQAAAPTDTDSGRPRPHNTPKWLDPVLASFDWLAFLGGALAALSLAALTMLITSEISLRLLSNYFEGLPAGTPIAWEYSAYLMGIAFMAGSALTLRARGHIRVSVLLSQLSDGGRRILEIIASFIGFCLCGFLAYSLALFTWGSFTRGQTSISSDTPIWIPEAAITFGALVLALQLLARLLRAYYGLPVEDTTLQGPPPEHT